MVAGFPGLFDWRIRSGCWGSSHFKLPAASFRFGSGWNSLQRFLSNDSRTKETHANPVFEGFMCLPLSNITCSYHLDCNSRGRSSNKVSLPQFSRLQQIPTVIFTEVCVLEVPIGLQCLSIKRNKLCTQFKEGNGVVVGTKELQTVGVYPTPSLGSVPKELIWLLPRTFYQRVPVAVDVLVKVGLHKVIFSFVHAGDFVHTGHRVLHDPISHNLPVNCILPKPWQGCIDSLCNLIGYLAILEGFYYRRLEEISENITDGCWSKILLKVGRFRLEIKKFQHFSCIFLGDSKTG